VIGWAGASWPAAAAALAVLGLLLFIVAIRSGRWGVWLAGYLVALLALVIALAAGHNRAAATTPTGMAVVAQPSAGPGVEVAAGRCVHGSEAA
jgi:hypothetical protein